MLWDLYIGIRKIYRFQRNRWSHRLTWIESYVYEATNSFRRKMNIHRLREHCPRRRSLRVILPEHIPITLVWNKCPLWSLAPNIPYHQIHLRIMGTLSWDTTCGIGLSQSKLGLTDLRSVNSKQTPIVNSPLLSAQMTPSVHHACVKQLNLIMGKMHWCSKSQEPSPDWYTFKYHTLKFKLQDHTVTLKVLLLLK